MTETQPNILLIMGDEHSFKYAGPYGHNIVKTPNLDELAAEGTTFDSAYCTSPVCVPSRMSLLTGRYGHEVDSFDLASQLRSDAVTYPHVLRNEGYDAVLAGKQHFLGPDQLHGFREQLSVDMHADEHPLFAWPDDEPADDLWSQLQDVGRGTSEVIEADRETEERSIDYIRSRREASASSPWMLCASFVGPHWPYKVPDPYWSMYWDNPECLELDNSNHIELHPVLERMRLRLGLREVPETSAKKARAAYFGLITLLDERIGRILQALKDTDQWDNTVIMYTSDHGGFVGERRLWRKMNFYEESVRVPLILRDPRRARQISRCQEVVSLVDLTQTIVSLAGGKFPVPTRGRDLVPLISPSPHKPEWENLAFSEYLGHGIRRPTAMLRKDNYKYIKYVGDRPSLFDLATDPNEVVDLAVDDEHQSVVQSLESHLSEIWDEDEIEARVLQSQRERIFIRAVLGDS